MSVEIQFDSNHNPIEPKLVLAQRSGNKIGLLKVENLHCKRCFNTYSELSFDVCKVDNEYWDDIVDFKLLWCKDWDMWFEIYVSIREDNALTKTVTAKTLGEAELSQTKLYGFEANTEDDIMREDYEPTVFYNSSDHDCSLLHRIFSKTPHYSIAFVAASLQGIQRTFNFNDTSIYDALQDVAQELDCYIDFSVHSDENGKPKRSISVYDLEAYCYKCGHRGNFENVCPECGSDLVENGYGEDTNIFVCVENLTDSIEYTTSVDSVKNCFRLEAGDDLMTAAITSYNPNGSRYIWYISDDMKKDMPKELVAKLEEYDALYKMYETNYDFTPGHPFPISHYNELVEKYKAYHNLESISTPIKNFSGIMNAYYDTIDMRLLLESSLMPTAETIETSAKEQAARITRDRMSPLGVTNLSTTSQSTMANAAVLLARSLVDQRYQVKTNGSSYNSSTHTLSLSFTVTNYYNSEDTATTPSISITITDNYKTYVEQVASKMLSTTAKSATDIVALFELDDTAFQNELKKYSLNRLISFNEACEACFNVLIEHGASTDVWGNESDDLYTELYVPYRNKQTMIQSEIQVREDELQRVDILQDVLTGEIDAIQSALNFENFLGETYWKIFSSYRREDTYSNSNYISDGLSNLEIFDNARQFFETAKNDIIKSATLQHSLTATLKNLLVMREFDGLTSKFEVGNWIRLRADGVIYKLRLLEYEIDFSDLSNLPVTFSDVVHVLGNLSDSESIFSQARSMASSYDNVTRQAEKGKSSNERLQAWAEKGLALTALKIMNDADSQDYVFDSHGMLFRKYLPLTDSFGDEQLKIINSTIAMTDNNWKSVRTAIGAMYYLDPIDGTMKYGYGVNGETIIGKLILGEQLGIYNTAATLRFNKDGLYVSNGTVTFTANPNNLSKLFAITVASQDVLSVTSAGNLAVTGQITATSGFIGGTNGWHIGSGCIYSGKTSSSDTSEGIYISPSIIYLGSGTNSIIKLEKSGKITANNAEITGKITATSGTIGGCEISNGKLSIPAANISGQLTASQINATNLKVAAANITGTLTASQINTSGLKVAAANITGTLTASQINTSGLSVAAANITGKLTASQINADGISAKNVSISGTINATQGTIGATTYPFTIGTSGTKNSPCIYSRQDVSGGGYYAGPEGIGIKADNYVYIGGDGFSYWGGPSQEGMQCDYLTAIRPAVLLLCGDRNGKQQQNTGIRMSCATLEFLYGGNSNLRLSSNGLANISTPLYFEIAGTTGKVWMYGNLSVGGNISGNTSGSIVSDRNKKNTILPFAEPYEKLFDMLLPVTYKYNYGTSNRTHSGFIAQDVASAIEKSGLTTQDFAAYIETEDEKGDTVRAIRYEEFVAINTWQIQKLKARVAELEKLVAAINSK